MPARFLRAVTFEGLEKHLFEDDRAADPSHAFNNPRYAGATILIVNQNFGCGSSREHAPQGLARYGIRAIVGEPYSEIFLGNSAVLGIPCFTADHASIEALWLGALLAVLVVFWFLRDWRATLISAIAMPLSVIPTFYFMSWLGFTLNIITLLGLSLVVGILVNDAIVEIENIVRHMSLGKSPYRAALEAADEIGLAVIATTLTIVAVFVPVSFMASVPGQFFRQFGISVAIAVVFSLLVARQSRRKP